VVEQYNGEIIDDYIDEFGNHQQATILTGLSATVFERNGVSYLAVRGTAGLADLLTDAIDIALLGTPERQLQYSALKAKVAEWLDGGTLASGFTVAGHSLGGFLAGALLVDYPTQIGDAYLYNAPGAGGLGAGLRQLLKLEHDPSLDLARVTNLRAEGGGSMVAGLGLAWGTPIPVQIEVGQNPLDNHSIVTLTDALAVYDLFGRADANLQLTAIGEMLKAVSSRSEATLESAVRSLGRLFLATAPEVATGDREALYRTCEQIRAVLPASGLTVIPLTTLTAAELQTAASNPDAFATRYALRELNPFAVLGADYSRFNQNGELDLFDPATGAGRLTAEYIADRAAQLAWQVLLNTRDVLTSPARPYSGDEVSEATQFADRATGSQIVLGGQLASRRRILFGAAGMDLLDGGTLNDRLYGGAGNDVLNGNGGADYLEGGDGDDRLFGGLGHDIYQVGVGQGTDTVVDAAEADGRQQGEIRFGEAAVAGTFAALDAELRTFTLTLPDGQYYAGYTGSVRAELAGRLTLWRADSGARIAQLENFRSGDFGIVLGSEAPARQYTEIAGTEAADNGELGGTMAHEASLATTAEAQRVLGLGGADCIVLSHAHALGYGGAGNDRIIDGAGAQSQYGEDGDDCLVLLSQSMKVLC
jgi:hypothetical protein